MRVAIMGLLLAIVMISGSAFAKEKIKPKPAPLHDRPSVTCKLNYAGELGAAREAAQSKPIAIYPIDGLDVAAFLKVFNDAEPKTDFKAERVLVMASPYFAYIELFTNDCVSEGAKIAPETFEEMMWRAFGDEPSPDGIRM